MASWKKYILKNKLKTPFLKVDWVVFSCLHVTILCVMSFLLGDMSTFSCVLPS